jgi:hypothetical protein
LSSPVCPGGPDRPGIAVVGQDSEIYRLGGIPDAHLGSLFRRPAVHWLVLAEPGQAGRLGPGRFIEGAVNRRDGFDPGNGDGGAVFSVKAWKSILGLDQQ